MSRIYKAVQGADGQVRIVEVTPASGPRSTGGHFVKRHSGPGALSSRDIDYIKARSQETAIERDKIMNEKLANGEPYRPGEGPKRR